MPTSDPHPAPINWPLFALPDSDGRLHYPALAASVRQAIRIVLATRPGEQLMRPDFGAGLENLLHEPNTVATRRRIYDLIVEALARWESRLLLDRVDVSEVADRPGEVRVEILYRLRRTGAPQQMGLTVQLEA